MSKSDHSFAVMPSVSISRSRFARTSQNKTSIKLGEIVPIYCDEVLPGDTRSFDMAALVRLNTPLAPIMDNIYIDYYAFFVPMRLTWVHAKEFFGENSTSAGIPSVTYTIPKCTSSSVATSQVGSLMDYMGLPLGAGVDNIVSALPFRGVALIYNRWFRNENLIAPLPVSTSDTNNVLLSGGSINNSDFLHNASKMLKASKLADYFSKSLPFAQKGAPISIPLGTTADLKVYNSSGQVVVVPDNITKPVGGYDAITLPGSLGYDLGGTYEGQLKVDLTTATAATINQLRYAFQLQKLLEKDALYGTRYWEILKAHFGVTSPDASLQDPEFLGGKRQRINIDQVISTATGSNTEYTTNSQLGALGANSVTGTKSSLFTKSFTEHGYLYVFAVARHDQTYCQGINRMWTRSGRYDFYWPVFANLGAQDVRNKEIYFQNSQATDDAVFGYQEAWSEYRYKPSIVTGLMRPNVTGALDYWSLANNFASLPTLSQSFVEQDRNAINRCLTSTDFDFICDFYFTDIAVRAMPTYSIPGLIDHH